jgi:hypothetical protein
MGGCKRTSLNRKMAPARKSLAGGEEGRRTRLRRGAFQFPLSAAQGQQGGDAPIKASYSDLTSIWTGSSTTNEPTGAGTKTTHKAKPPRSHLNNAILRFLLGCFGPTIPVFPIDGTSFNKLRRFQGGKSYVCKEKNSLLDSPARERRKEGRDGIGANRRKQTLGSSIYQKDRKGGLSSLPIYARNLLNRIFG